MEQLEIKSFVDEQSGLIIKDMTAFIGESIVILFERNGHMLIIDSESFAYIRRRKLPPILAERLQSRCFAESIMCESKCDKEYQVIALPEFFMIDLTNRCNMHCMYCLRDVGNLNRTISTKTVEDICGYIVRYCNENHLQNVTIQPWGGEPLLELDKILLMRKLVLPKKTKVHFSVETNGLLLTDETIDKLYQNKIGLGISIDGNEAVHNVQRIFPDGKGTHEIVEKNLLRAKKWYDKRLGTITTVTKRNAPYIEEILEYFAVELGLSNVKFNFVHKSMFSDCDGLCLSKEEIADIEIKLLSKLTELIERGYRITEYNMKVKLKNILFKQYSDICHSCGCSGGRKMIVFDMEGRIFPCELTDIPSENIGSIYTGEKLTNFVADAMKHRDFFDLKQSELCKECLWYVFCRGGCTVRAISADKRPPEIDEIECAVNRSLYPALMQLILEKPGVVNQILGEMVLEA